MRGSAHLRIGTWVVAVVLAVVCSGSYPSQNGSPNLKPFKPRGWSDVIVVSNRQGDNLNSGRLAPSDIIFVDFAVINSGSSPVTRPFRIDLFVDGQLWNSFDAPSPLDPQVFRFREDYPIGRLGVGTHALRIVADAGNQVAESDEDDNEYTRTIIVAGDCSPLTMRVSPRGAGTLTPSREPNCGEATVSASSLPVIQDSLDKGLDIAGEPIVKAQRAKAFSALRAKVRSQDHVRVIVGVRTEGRSSVSAAGSLGEATSRSPLIARAQQSLLNRMDNLAVSSIRRFKFIPYVAMDVDEAALESLAVDPEVVSIEEDLAVKPLLADSTLLIGAPPAWAQGYSGSGQTIAILDTGVDKDHPFLAGKVASEACYSGSSGTSLCPDGVSESILPGSGAPCPSSLSDCFHGTAMAGVAAGRGREFSGVARDARIIAIQVFSQCGEDCINSSNSDWLAGLERVLELSADFDIAAVNMSFGSGYFSKDCDSEFPAVKAAMDNLRAVGIAPVAPSGNEGYDSGINLPACISSAISVGSTGDGSGEAIADEVSDFSNSSPVLDLLAPGALITTSTLDNEFISVTGTSLSVPHVAGAWGVMKSKAPNASVPQLLSLLMRTGIPITDPRNGLVTPRIQVDAAIDAVIPEHSYSSGTLLTLTASPNPGFRFKSWQGCESASGNRCVVGMDSIKRVFAVFEPSASNLPDLITTSLTGPSTATIASTASISAVIRNQGPANASPFRLGLFLSADTSITTDDTWFAACSYEAGLLAGESESCSRSFPIPPRVSPGRYYL